MRLSPFIQMKLPRLVLLALCFSFNIVQSQQILPIPPQAQSLKDWTIYGGGSAEEITSNLTPSARLAGRFAPNQDFYFFISLNKGAGLATVSADSFDVQSLVTPQIGTTSFLGSLSHTIKVWSKASDERHEIALFLDVSHQTRTVTKLAKEESFKAYTYSPGVRYSYLNYKVSQYAISLGVSFSYLEISENVDAFRRVIGFSDAPSIYRSLIGKLAIQFSDFLIELQVQNVSATDPFGSILGSEDSTIPRLTGRRFIMRTSVFGKIFDF